MTFKKRDAGLTLVELLIGSAVLIGGGGALVAGMHYTLAHSDYLAQLQIALNAAQGQLDQLAATPFDTLWGPAYESARGAGQCVGIGEDANCNGVLNAGEDFNGNGVLDEPLPGGRLILQIKSADDRAPLNPAQLYLHVAACWRSRGRSIGEDQNCNGALDVGEDGSTGLPPNGWVDSPAMASTLISRRD